MTGTQLLAWCTNVPAFWPNLLNSRLSGMMVNQRPFIPMATTAIPKRSRQLTAITRSSMFFVMSAGIFLPLMLTPASSLHRWAEADGLSNVALINRDMPTTDLGTAASKVADASKKSQSDFVDDLFGDPRSSKDKKKAPETLKNKALDPPKNTERKTPKSDPPQYEGSGSIDYSNLESFDFGFAVEGAPNAAFSADIPNYWNRIDNGLSNQLIFASPDSDEDAKMSVAITGELARGRTDKDVATAHAVELRDIGDAKIITNRAVKLAAGPGWRVLLKVTSPSDMDIMLVDELIVIRSGPVLYKLEMTAPEPIWHVARQIMKRMLDTLYIAQ